MKILRKVSQRSNFPGSYNKKECNLHRKFTRRFKPILLGNAKHVCINKIRLQLKIEKRNLF